MKEKLDVLAEKIRQSMAGGGEARQKKHSQGGRFLARQRLELLFDPDTFVELDRLVTHTCSDFGMQDKKIIGDGVVTGWGLVNGRKVFAFSQDFTVFGGSLSLAHARKICKIMDMAMDVGAPVVGFNDSGGARIQEGVDSLGGYAEIFFRNTEASGVIPQISLIMGPCAGGAVYSPAITDFIGMVDNTSYMFVTGPDVIREVTNEVVDLQSLGGAAVHNEVSGVAHFRHENELFAIAHTKELLSYLPQNYREKVPRASGSDVAPRFTERLRNLIPENQNKPYDMLELIRQVVDEEQILEVMPDFALNIVTGFSRIGGHSVGIVANNPAHLAGVLDINSSNKGARFVRFCDAFNIPIVTFVDVPGFLPGVQQEYGGIIKNGAKLLYAYCEATVPKLTLITRKAYGGAYDVMASKHIRADLNLAYPNAEIAVMGAKGAVNILYRDKIRTEPSIKEQLIREYEDAFANPYIAASKGYLDEVIDPKDTRNRLISGLDMLVTKDKPRRARRHGNIPL